MWGHNQNDALSIVWFDGARANGVPKELGSDSSIRAGMVAIKAGRTRAVWWPAALE